MAEIAPNHSAGLLAKLREPAPRREETPPSFETPFADLLQASGAIRHDDAANSFVTSDLIGHATLRPDKLEATPLVTATPIGVSPQGETEHTQSPDDASDQPAAAAAASFPSASNIHGGASPASSQNREFSQESAPEPTAKDLSLHFEAPPVGPSSPLPTPVAGESECPSYAQPVRATAATKPGSASPSFARTVELVLAQSQQQAQSSAVHVAVLAVETGVRVVARAGALTDTEKSRLKMSIANILAEHGLGDAGSVITQTTPQSRASFQEG